VAVGVNSRVATAASMQYVNEQVYARRALVDALAWSLQRGSQFEKEMVSPLLCEAGYAGYGIRTVASQPSQEQADAANTILTLGR
jgi:hypothetical protein